MIIGHLPSGRSLGRELQGKTAEMTGIVAFGLGFAAQNGPTAEAGWTFKLEAMLWIVTVTLFLRRHRNG